MPDSVCCPTCWSWVEPGKRTTCKRCRTPLIFADGRTVGEVAANPAGTPLVPAFAGSAPVYPMAAVSRRGTDWVDVARLVTIGYGALLTVALLVFGLVFQHVSVPITDPNTGITTVQTLNIGPAFAVAAIFVGGVFALFAWLTKFFIARIIFLIFDGLAILSALSSLGAGQTGAFGLLSAADLMIDLVYGGVLVMSIMSTRSASRS